MASAIEIQPPATQARVLGLPRSAVLGALLIETSLILGILLPLRLDRNPPSLAVNLASKLGTDLRGLALYLSIVAVLSAGYLLALAGIGGTGRRALLPVLAAASIFALTALAAHPAYSSDVFHYIAAARVSFTYGENPHTVPPEAFPDDPAMLRSGWKWVPSPYGPAWSWLSALPWSIAGDAADGTRAVLAFKTLTAVCLIGTAAGLALAAERLRDGSGATAALLFGWNPVVLIHLGVDGHNDAAMLLALALGALALARNKDGFALAFFAIAVLVKPAAIFAFVILAGVLLRERRWRQAALGAGTLLLAAVVLWWPFWEGARTFEAMLDEGRYFTTTPASLLQRALEPYVGGDPARVLVGGALRVALAALVLLAILRTAARPAAVLLAIGEIYLLAVVVLGTWYQPWYATWPLLFLAVAAATGAPRALPLVLGLTAGALLAPVAVNFVTALSGRSARDAAIDLLATGLVILPILLAAWHWMPSFFRGPSELALVSSAEDCPPEG